MTNISKIILNYDKKINVLQFNKRGVEFNEKLGTLSNKLNVSKGTVNNRSGVNMF